MNDDGEDEKAGLLTRALEWALTIEPSACIDILEGLKHAHPEAAPRELAKFVVARYARRGAVEGFVSGLASNPIVMVPSAVADVGVMLRFYAGMTAVIGLMANPRYFDDPQWRDDALFMLAGRKALSRLAERAGVEGGKQTTKVLIRKYLSKEVLAALKRWILKWFGKKVTQRAIIAKAIPLVGGLIGGTWNYVEIRVIGRRIINYHFNGELT